MPQNTLYRFKIYMHCDCGGGSASYPTEGAYSAPQTPTCIKGIRFATENKVDRAGGKGGDGGEEWIVRGRDGEEMEDVDFATSYKNSCERPCEGHTFFGPLCIFL